MTLAVNNITNEAGTGAPNFPNGLQLLGTQVNGVLGVGQTWQDLTASRSVGTTFTNTTGKPIQIHFFVVLTANIASPTAAFEINGVNVGWYRGSGAAANLTQTFAYIVPAGATYRALAASGISLVGWSELR